MALTLEDANRRVQAAIAKAEAVGAIGASGATAEQDEACALAGRTGL